MLPETGFPCFVPVSFPSRFMNNYYSTHRKEQTMFGLKQDAATKRLWELFDRCFAVVPKPLSEYAQRKHDAHERHVKAKRMKDAEVKELFRFQQNEYARMKLDESIRIRAECGRSVLEYYLNRPGMLPIVSSAFLLWFVLWLPLTGAM